MISLVIAEEIHKRIINRFGGGYGVRDVNLLLSVLARPYATFDQNDLYPTGI